jgi:hypothetical protein
MGTNKNVESREGLGPTADSREADVSAHTVNAAMRKSWRASLVCLAEYWFEM